MAKKNKKNQPAPAASASFFPNLSQNWSFEWGPVFFVALLAVYLAYPDKVFVVDGVMFAGIIERAGDNWRENLFNHRHFLFNPSLMVLRDILSRFGSAVDGYSLIQRVNAVLGAVGAWVYYRLVQKITGSRAVALMMTSALAVSASYWSRATEGQVYMTMTFLSIVAVYRAVILIEDASLMAAGSLCLTLITAVLFHIVNVALFPLAAVAFWLSAREYRKSLVLLIPLSLLLVGLPFTIYFKLTSPNALLSFLTATTEFYSPDGSTSWVALLNRLFHYGHFSIRTALVAVISNGYDSLVFARSTEPFSLGVSICAGLIGLIVAGMGWKKKPKTVALLVLWWGSFTAIEIFWQGGPFFWACPLAALLAVASIPLATCLQHLTERQMPATVAASTLLIGGLGLSNLRSGIIPQSRIESNENYALNGFIAKHTPAFSRVVTSGAYSPVKFYLPYFFQRNCVVLEYFINGKSRDEGLRQFKNLIRRNIRHGIPLYALSDILDDPEALSDMQKRLNVSRQDVLEAFGPGSFYRIAMRGKVSLSLFLPKNDLPALYAILVHNLLRDQDNLRQQEYLELLRALAERVRAAHQMDVVLDYLKKSDYGAYPLMSERAEEIGASFNPEQYIDGFNKWKESPDFHVRLGFIYYYSGARRQAREELVTAYRQTLDPSLITYVEKIAEEKINLNKVDAENATLKDEVEALKVQVQALQKAKQ